MSVTCCRLVVCSINKTDCHDIAEILLKVTLNTITLTPCLSVIQIMCCLSDIQMMCCLSVIHVIYYVSLQFHIKDLPQ